MAYRDIFVAKGFQHLFELDGNVTDSIGSVVATNTGGILTRPGLCQDAINCFSTNGLTDRLTIPNTVTINFSSQERKAVIFWFNASEFIQPFTSIFREGNTSTYFQITMGVGNSLTYEVRTGGISAQVYSGDSVIVPGRFYMLGLIFSGSNYDNLIQAILDNKILDSYDGETLGSLGIVSLPSRSPVEVGDPVGTAAIDGTSIVLNAPVIGDYNYLAFADGGPAILSKSDIDEIFAEGAVPNAEINIVSDTEANMQLAIDAISGTILTNRPLSINIEAVSGDGNLNLSSGDITPNELASLDIRYAGSGTLTWTNSHPNATFSQEKAFSANGTIVIENPTNLTINFTQSASEVRIYDNNGVDSNDFGTELSGVEDSAGTQFVYQHNGSTNDIIIQIIKSGYEEILFPWQLSNQNQNVSFIQEAETNI